MITKKEIEFMLEIYKNPNNMVTAKEQNTYVLSSNFYKMITKLKNMNLINTNTSLSEYEDRRYNLYELTLRGITLIKILLGEDY